MSTAPTLAPLHSSEAAMSMLRKGIPLSLLIDLAFGPHSEELFVEEVSQLPTQRPPQA